MALWQKFNCFPENLVEKVHNLASDTLTVALCAAANPPLASNTILANLTQISYTNLSARVITVTDSSQSSGTYKLQLQDLVLSASGGAVAGFEYIVVYNDTPTSPADPLIFFYDYAATVTLGDTETFTVGFGGTSGLMAIA